MIYNAINYYTLKLINIVHESNKGISMAAQGGTVAAEPFVFSKFMQIINKPRRA